MRICICLYMINCCRKTNFKSRPAIKLTFKDLSNFYYKQFDLLYWLYWRIDNKFKNILRVFAVSFNYNLYII